MLHILYRVLLEVCDKVFLQLSQHRYHCAERGVDLTNEQLEELTNQQPKDR
jgi:hypothetical protein